MANLCDDCKQTSDSKNDLKCKKHIICQDCLVRRVHSQHQDVFDCMLCESNAVQPSSFAGKLPGIHIFVDDSNIWIEAKKLQGRAKGFKANEDHRVRIDMGKLADLIADGRCVQEGVLYGSEPPPVDTVWKKIREKGWRVNSQRRSLTTGKEKKVDTSLATDVTETAILTPLHERTTIVVVSGDSDMIPALDKILKQERWKIEIYMWRHAIAKGLTRYAADNSERVEIKHLDAYLGKATYTSMKFPIASNPQLKRKVKESGVVLTMVPDAFGNRIPDEAWCEELESIAQWPFQYYWFERDGKATDHLVLVFINDREGEKFNIASFLETIKTSGSDDSYNSSYHLPKVTLVQTFLNFVKEIFEDEPDEVLRQLDAVLEKPGQYDQEDVCGGSNNEKDYVSDSEGKWSQIYSKKRPPRQHKYSEPCPFKFNCRHGTRCLYQHSEEERKDFSQRKDGRGNRLRKTEECTHFMQHQCRKIRSECDFAHGAKDAWCPRCLSVGHYRKDCPKK